MKRPSATKRFAIVTWHHLHSRSGRSVSDGKSDDVGKGVSIQAFS